MPARIFSKAAPVTTEFLEEADLTKSLAAMEMMKLSEGRSQYPAQTGHTSTWWAALATISWMTPQATAMRRSRVMMATTCCSRAITSASRSSVAETEMIGWWPTAVTSLWWAETETILLNRNTMPSHCWGEPATTNLPLWAEWLYRVATGTTASSRV